MWYFLMSIVIKEFGGDWDAIWIFFGIKPCNLSFRGVLDFTDLWGKHWRDSVCMRHCRKSADGSWIVIILKICKTTCKGNQVLFAYLGFSLRVEICGILPCREVLLYLNNKKKWAIPPRLPLFSLHALKSIKGIMNWSLVNPRIRIRIRISERGEKNERNGDQGCFRE